MKQLKKYLSLLLCLALCLSLLPAAALAEGNSEDFSAGEEETEAAPAQAAQETSGEMDAAVENAVDSADVPSDEWSDAELLNAAEPYETVCLDDVSIADNDDLFAGYVNQVLYGGSETVSAAAASSEDEIVSEAADAYSSAAGDQLTDNNAIMYNTLKSQIAQVAAGKITDTHLKVPLKSLMTDFTYKAADLGVDEITKDNVKGLVSQILVYSAKTVASALMADYPYEMYWFDKTNGIPTSVNYTYDSSSITFIDTGYVWYFFCVVSDYAADPTVSPSYKADAEKTGATSGAVANAQSIVAAAADYSYYDKLVYYRDQICDLTSYNEEAAAAGTNGDPWQLIYVFDDDPETSVVCEGYAKAFKYLCDLTDFGSYNIRCITVGGTMNGSGHMWNVVLMPNGSNYLVDVTNCDSGRIGAPDLLFLCGGISGSVSEGYTVELTDSESVTYTYDATSATNVYPASYLELSYGGWYNPLNSDHAWSAWAEDEDDSGDHVRACTVCGLTDTCVRGDAYRNYEVNLKDLLVLKKYLCGSSVSIYKEGADFDWNGSVNLLDMLMLKQQLANS